MISFGGNRHPMFCSLSWDKELTGRFTHHAKPVSSRNRRNELYQLNKFIQIQSVKPAIKSFFRISMDLGYGSNLIAESLQKHKALLGSKASYCLPASSGMWSLDMRSNA